MSKIFNFPRSAHSAKKTLLKNIDIRKTKFFEFKYKKYIYILMLYLIYFLVLMR